MAHGSSQQFRQLFDTGGSRQSRGVASAGANIALQVKVFAPLYDVQAGMRVALHRQQFVARAEILLKYRNTERLPEHFAI